ncbi:MAG: hypothetical protein ACK5LL_01140 [Suipraeoptans sp.]
MEKKIRPQDKWDAKAGVGSKSYKVNLEVDKRFKEICDQNNLKYGTVLTKLMQDFISKN